MPSIASKLSPDQIAALASYLSFIESDADNPQLADSNANVNELLERTSKLEIDPSRGASALSCQQVPVRPKEWGHDTKQFFEIAFTAFNSRSSGLHGWRERGGDANGH